MSCCEKLRGLLLWFVLMGISVLIVQGSGGDHESGLSMSHSPIPPLEDPPPILKITMSQATYVNGETVATTQFLMENLATTEARVELALWLELPGIEPISVINIGSDNTLVVPPSVSQESGPLTLFTVTPSFPRGGYAFNSRMVNPVTKKFRSEDINPIMIQ